MGRTVFTLILVVLTLAGALTATDGSRARAQEQRVEIFVKLAAGTDVNAIALRHGLTVSDSIKAANGYLLTASGGNADKLTDMLAREIGVVSSERNQTITTPIAAFRQPNNFPDPGDTPTILGSDVRLFTGQPLVKFLKLDQIRAISQGKNIKVAIIDTGIDPTHPVFAGRIVAGGYDFVARDSRPIDEPGGGSYGHGTFIAGLLALVAPEARILPLRALNPDGMGSAFDVAKAIHYAADQGAKVINLSLGTDERPESIKMAIAYAQRKGVLIVAAAGNDNASDGRIYPANDNYVLGIAATDFNDEKASFSNYGFVIDFSAPGVELVSTYPGGLYASWSGTSFAAPLVSGEGALLFAKYNCTVDQAIKIMQATSVNGDRIFLGHGRIAPSNALRR